MTKICAKNDFYIFVSSDLDLGPLEFKFAPLVALFHDCVSTKLEVSTLSYFEKVGGAGRTDRQTDGRGATLNAAPWGGPPSK